MSSRRCSRAVTRCTSSTTSRRARASSVPAAATLHVHDVRESLDALAQETGAEAIVHLAAQADVRVSVAEPAFDAAVNVVGTVNVLEAARLVGARVVFASTGGAIYGECARPARETTPACLSPRTAPRSWPARATSARSRRLTARRTWRSASGTSTGPRQDPHGEAGVVAIFLGRLLEGEPLPDLRRRLPERATTSTSATSPGRRSRRSTAMPAACSTSAPASPRPCSSSTRSAARSSGSDAAPVHEAERPGELGRSVLDGELAAETIGFRPETSLATGVAATWAVGSETQEREEGAGRRRANVVPWTYPFSTTTGSSGRGERRRSSPSRWRRSSCSCSSSSVAR